VMPPAGIASAHDAAHVVAARVQARNRRAGAIDHAPRGIRAQPGKGAQAARHHLDALVRRPLDRRDAWIGRPVRIAVQPIERHVATAEAVSRPWRASALYRSIVRESSLASMPHARATPAMSCCADQVTPTSAIGPAGTEPAAQPRVRSDG
jgi:hypothetical protein